jgi:hypothetical protein
MSVKRFRATTIVATIESAALLVVTGAATIAAFAQESGSCVDISGPWNGTENISLTCAAMGEQETVTESGSGAITINQTGCEINYQAAGADFIRRGTVADRNVRISGPTLVESIPDVQLTENSLQAEGVIQGESTLELNGQIRLRGTFEGVEFACTGSSRALLTRIHSDMVINQVAVSHTAVQTHEPFVIDATVRNNGNISSARTTLRYLLSEDPVITRGDTELSAEAFGSLPQGGSSRRSRELSIDTAGTYWVGACVDPVMGEAPTNNNCSTGVKVTVCYSAAVAVLRGGPQTLRITEPHNVVLSNIKTLALATGNGGVAAEVFDAALNNPQIARVNSWLAGLNEGCTAPVPAVLVGHSLGGDGAIKVNYENVCSRILLDPFDSRLRDPNTLLPVFVQRGAPYTPREPPNDGAVFSFLAESKNVFLGRPLVPRSNVYQECINGTDHNSIVTSVLGTGAFQDTVVGRELRRCRAGLDAPTLGQYRRCASELAPVLTILPLLLDE